MSNRLKLRFSAPGAGEAAWEFVGDGYGYDALMAMFVASDCIEDISDPDGEYNRLAFSTNARAAADRLACYGFSHQKSVIIANAALVEPPSYPPHQPRLQGGEVLSELVDAWAKSVIDPNRACSDGDRGDTLIHELMTGNFATTTVFPMLNGLAVALHALPDGTVIEADLSESDWADEREDGKVFMRDYTPIELMSLTPASILCEGVFDARVIEFAIRMTHPHLVEHLEVAKFDFNREGSSSALSRLVRALADVRATGPRGMDEAPRIIAVFDADRAGALEAARLQQAELPSNFTVLTLPEREDLRSYPVIVPNGIEHHNVNGWGAAIETYLAVELGVSAPLVLSYDRGAAGGYQGALLQEGKAAVHDAFDRAAAHSRDWPVLASIVHHIVHAPGL